MVCFEEGRQDMLDWSNTAINGLSLAGIAWDFSGAVALSRGWFFVSDARLKRQAASAWGTNPATARAFAETRLDTRFGLGQLLLGFGMQFVASAGFSISPGISSLAIGVIPVAWTVYLVGYPYWVIRNGLRLSVSSDAAESTWRKHYLDMPDLLWNRVLVNEGIEFKYKVPPGPRHPTN